MPLTREVNFRRILEKGNRVQIPKTIIWQLKLEPDQVLKAGFGVPDKFIGWQFFYAKMENAGRILGWAWRVEILKRIMLETFS